MEEKEAKDENVEKDMRFMTLSSSFSSNRYMFYSTLRVIKSMLITSTTLWYSYYFLIRTDDEKAYSYFETKSSAQINKKRNALYRSNTRALLDKITIGSLLFCAATNILSKLKQRTLTKLLLTIKSSHSSKNIKNTGKIYLSQSDLHLLNKWKCLLGGNKYYLGSLDTSTLFMLYVSLTSETTIFDSFHHAYAQLQEENTADNDPCYDWKNRYYQFAEDKQQIEWPNNDDNDVIYDTDTYLFISQKILMGISLGLPTFILSYSCFPISTLCALHMFKCGLNMEHRQESHNWFWWNKWICFIGITGCIFQGIIHKLHFARYFAIRELTISTYKKMAIFGSGMMNKKKKWTERSKLERRLKNVLGLRSFSYDIVCVLPWICLYLSCVCTKSSTYYIKTFASSSLYNLFEGKHKKNKHLLRIAAVSTLMMGILVGLGNDSYFESVKYAKRWFMNMDEYSIESYQSKRKAKEILEEEEETPGNDNEIKDEENVMDEESDQIEGGERIRTKKIKYNALYQKLINGNYQKESEMLLSKRYFHQKAHDIFEYFTQICVFLEDKFLNSLIIPAF